MEDEILDWFCNASTEEIKALLKTIKEEADIELEFKEPEKHIDVTKADPILLKQQMTTRKLIQAAKTIMEQEYGHASNEIFQSIRGQDSIYFNTPWTSGDLTSVKVI